MKALVTGGTGFLGRHLVPFLHEKGIETAVLNSRNCDLTRRENLERIDACGYDRIYHLAAWTKAGDFALYHAGEQWLANQLINTNVLWYWREREPQATMITIGTSCAYPPDAELREENYMVGEPDDGLYTYAMTKRMLYQGVRALHQQFGMSYRYLIPSTLYGPGFDEEDSHFIFDLVRKIVRGKTNQEPVVLWGDGNQRRELIHVDDAVRLIEVATESRPNELLNIGSGVGLTIREYAEIICDIVGYDTAAIGYDRNRYVGVREKVLNCERLCNSTRFSFTDLHAGITGVVGDYLNRFESGDSDGKNSAASRTARSGS